MRVFALVILLCLWENEQLSCLHFAALLPCVQSGNFQDVILIVGIPSLFILHSSVIQQGVNFILLAQ
jgi:hypothetical protein